MEVKLNTEISSVLRTNGVTPKPKPAPVSGNEDAFFGQSQVLNNNLTDLPDLRVSEVQRAKLLTQTETYPPEEIQHKIATLLAVKLAEAEAERQA
jgi:hypothetical protein